MNELLKEEMGEVQRIQLDIWTGEIEEDEAKERFKIIDLGSANWAFRKLKAIEEKEKEIKDLVDIETKRLNEWAKHDTDKLNDSKNFFQGLLTEYFVTQKEVDPDFKISTPYGKVSSKKQQDKWNYQDELIIESLKKKGITDLIKSEMVEKVNKNDLKKEVEILEDVVSLDGEIVLNVKPYDEDRVLFINTESGEIYDAHEYVYHDRVVVYKNKVVEGVTVEERPDTITIKVVQ